MFYKQSICIVVPCYNEGKRLPILEFEAFLDNNNISFCFVNDGSNDNTLQVLAELQCKYENFIKVISNKTNLGKAESVRNGINTSLNWRKFDYVGYFDADLATPLNEIQHLMEAYSISDKYGFVLGSRIKRLGVNIDRIPARHYLGRIFATFASIVLALPVYDTQCGAKIIKSEIANIIFEQPFLSKWLFDIELIARTMKSYSTGIFFEVPLNEWIEKGDTRIKILDMFKFPFELIRIKIKYI